MEGLYKICISQEVTPNELMVLYTISVRHTAPERIKRDLNIKDMIARDMVKVVDRRPVLTEKGKLLLEQAIGMFLKNQTKRDLTKDPDFKTNVEIYCNLWPKINRIINGRKYPLREPAKEVMQAFNKFFTDYPDQEWSVILEVTQKYIDRHRDNMDYMLGSKTFIYKSENGMYKSRLALEIENKDSVSDDFVPDFFKPRSI